MTTNPRRTAAVSNLFTADVHLGRLVGQGEPIDRYAAVVTSRRTVGYTVSAGVSASFTSDPHAFACLRTNP